jgi:L-cysteine:1D-myo-inositol 2-amino-2-deoxy-alpha-D-glucopyranoside ligase
MQPWSEVSVPKLPVLPGVPMVFDSASLSLRALPIERPGTIYVCGITPYDATHMGHAATYLAFDTLIRTWRASGVEVNYAQNITDVDDPLLERALATNRGWQDIAAEQIELFRTDMVALRVIPPQNYVGVVEAMQIIEQSVVKLVQLGVAYKVDNDYYYDMSMSDMLGKVSHLSESQMFEVFAQRGGDPTREGKRNALDPMLWRARVGEDPYWPSELGEGRPGWHIECSAIATHYLGSNIDVQGGGSDLKFPHHEMSAAHAQSITEVSPFADNFMHAGMVALNGEKMSKSLGNLVFVSALRAAGVDPMAIRLTLLHHHYRSDWEWQDRELEQATLKLATWREAFSRPTGSADVVEQVLGALRQDLNTPAAIEIIDQWVSTTNSGDTSAPSAPMAAAVDALLGII